LGRGEGGGDKGDEGSSCIAKSRKKVPFIIKWAGSLGKKKATCAEGWGGWGMLIRRGASYKAGKGKNIGGGESYTIRQSLEERRGIDCSLLFSPGKSGKKHYGGIISKHPNESLWSIEKVPNFRKKLFKGGGSGKTTKKRASPFEM